MIKDACDATKLNCGEGWYWNDEAICPFLITIPDTSTRLPFGDEYVYVDLQSGEREKFPVHRYSKMYQIPYLYDTIMYRYLECRSPGGIINVMARIFKERGGLDIIRMKTLELGAGPGTFGEYLRKYLRIRNLVGLDIEPLALMAAKRDRPGLYGEYVVEDLCRLSPGMLNTSGSWDLVVAASAAGWGHIPVEGFQQAWDLLKIGGWFGIHVRKDDTDIGCRAICNWISGLCGTGQFNLAKEERIYHRRSVDGYELYYDFFLGIKTDRCYERE